ncbi:MAG TPA: hypothetical protein VFM68_03240 [Candidatus Saccharimonadales bacterium]|nr:hypothetical protein [Candidatus Saccharimonadales bacterium]
MKIQKKFGAAVLSLGLVIGLSGFAGATRATIDTTGPDSDNTIRSSTSQRVDVENDNDLDVENDNEQSAWTGEAEVEHNTTGGDAETGDAANHNDFAVSASIDNSASVAAMNHMGGNGGGDDHAVIENTGPDSDNHVVIEKRSTVEIDNDNNVDITNTNDQYASSGDAEVEGNTTGGNAVTGNASNTNSTSVKLHIKN